MQRRTISLAVQEICDNFWRYQRWFRRKAMPGTFSLYLDGEKIGTGKGMLITPGQ